MSLADWVGRLSQSVVVGIDHNVYPVSKIELGEDVADMRLCRREAHVQPVSYLLIAQSFGDKDDDLFLTLGE